MVLEKKGMALGKKGMVWRHAKRGWGNTNIIMFMTEIMNVG